MYRRNSQEAGHSKLLPRAIVTVQIKRESEQVLHQQGRRRQEKHGGGSLLAAMGDAIDDAIGYAIKTGYWSRKG